MTTRRWVIAAALLAGPLAAGDAILVTRQRRLDFEHRALDHSLAASVYGRDAAEPTAPYCFDPPPPRDPARAAYHAALARKWSNAAQRAWLPVADEPSPPK
jgi:hypothetical protein